jgi:hypothetical protein|tara:strand:+ start:282 stop:467 length:186 start_codon:yes stop_codon:yes gene_type:complete
MPIALYDWIARSEQHYLQVAIFYGLDKEINVQSTITKMVAAGSYHSFARNACAVCELSYDC